MNKAELISKVAEKAEVSKVEAARLIETVIGTIIDGAVAEGESVVPGLGKLKLVEVAASEGVAMGKKWTKPAHKKLKLNLSTEGKAIGN